MAGEMPSSRRARGGVLALCLAAIVAGACSGADPSVPAGSTGTPKPVPSEKAAASSLTVQPSLQPEPDLPGLRELAKDELEAWDAANAGDHEYGLFRPAGSLDGQIGSWESKEIETNDTQALRAGMVTAVPLPTERPAHGFFNPWSAGAPAWDVTLKSAQRVFEEIRAVGLASGYQCPDCRPIRFTGAKLIDVDIDANLEMVAGPTVGKATTQAWAFTLDNSGVLITRVAVAPRIYPIPPTRDVFHPLGDLTFQAATGRAGSPELTIGFTVSKKDASHPCTMNYATETVESKSAVVVILVPRSDPAVDNSDTCVALGTQRSAAVHLAAPLGVRAVLESVTGQPVDVTLLP